QGPLPVGQEGRQDHDPVGGHEAAGDDRQGPVARADHPVPRRAHGRRRRRAAARHVGDGAGPARERRDRDSDHPLHRGGRGDGRPDRGHQPRRTDRGVVNHGADADARPAPADPSAAGAAPPGAAGALRRAAGAVRGRRDAHLHLRRPGRAHWHRRAAAAAERPWHRLQGPADQGELPRGDLRHPGEAARMNLYAVKAIFLFEMARWLRTLMQSLAAPVITTSLYFIVFGSAIGGRIQEVDGVSYGAFIVPGLILLSILTESISNASFGIYMPKFAGTIYEVLSAPVSAFEVVLGYVGAAATKSVLLGLIMLATARLFVPYEIEHPLVMGAILVLIAVTFSLFGFIIGVWADGWEKLSIVPILVVTPLTFLGGSFYSIDMLPEFWRTVTLFNPVVYLISAFRWSFYGVSDVDVGTSIGMTLMFMGLCLAAIWWIFRTGYKLKS